MKMRNMFENTSAPWVRYSSYEYKETDDGILYITVSENARPEFYYTMKDFNKILMDAVRIGRITADRSDSDEARDLVLEFVNSYGFLGLMTALPTTVDFIEYEAVYLPKNHFIKAETLSTENYLKFFYPFDKLYFKKEGTESVLNIDDRYAMAISLTMGDGPQSVTMSFQKEYAERYDWIASELADWAFAFMASFIYYTDKDRLEHQEKRIFRQGMHSFGAISPTYRLELGEDRPIVIWDFYSLAVMIQMSFSVLLSDPDTELGLCKNCDNFFIAPRKGMEFCGSKCRNRYNVSRSRSKKRKE